MSQAQAKKDKIVICWFRRDLRLEDNTALAKAMASGYPVLPVFIFDTHIIDELPRDDPRVYFIYSRLEQMHHQLLRRQSALHLYTGVPIDVWKDLLAAHKIHAVYANKDYEPYAIQRDRELDALFTAHGIPFHLFKDQVIFEEDEIIKKDGKPYTVFTPYKRKWLEQFNDSTSPSGARETGDGFWKTSRDFPSLGSLGFRPSTMAVPPYDLTSLSQYPDMRELPAADATSHLSPHLRFGTVSIRQIVSALGASDEVFLSELIWREFFMQILYHFPRVVDQSFKAKYKGIKWRNDEQEFTRWKEGKTGYAMVDAGMRQLNESGTMHNRVRMITASFLCKHLLIDWRWGEAYFAEKLLDYELSSNNGNWQWAAGTGCDAAPYFRIFNPLEQKKKFDPAEEYVRRWVPEYGSQDYPDPMIDHRFARTRALKSYKEGIDNYLPEV